MMERADFVRKLERVAPALATTDLIEVLTFFWFNGDTVMAYNDQIAISIPMVIPFKGAVPGVQLLKFLQASKTKGLEFNTDKENELVVKTGGSRIKLPVSGVESFMFDMPAVPTNGFTLTEDFIEQLECCLISVTDDPTMPDRLGVTFMNEDDKSLTMFSTTGNVITVTKTPVTKHGLKKGERVTIIGAFCRYLISLYKSDKKVRMTFSTDQVLAVGASGLMLYGRVVEVGKPLNFRGVIDEHVPDLEAVVAYHEKLPGAIKRAVLLVGDEGELKISVDNGKALLISETPRGEVKDWFTWTDHPDVRLRVQPRLLHSAAPYFNSILFTPKCVVLASEDRVHLISASTG